MENEEKKIEVVSSKELVSLKEEVVALKRKLKTKNLTRTSNESKLFTTKFQSVVSELNKKVIILFLIILFILPYFKEVFYAGFFELYVEAECYVVFALLLDDELLFNLAIVGKYCFIIMVVLDIISCPIYSFRFKALTEVDLIIADEDLNSQMTVKATVLAILYKIWSIFYTIFEIFAIVFGFAWLPFINIIEEVDMFAATNPSGITTILNFIFREEMIYLIIILITYLCKIINDIRLRSAKCKYIKTNLYNVHILNLK